MTLLVFMELNADSYPYIQMPALFSHSEARRVKIDFSKPVAPTGTGLNSAQGVSADYVHSNDVAPARRHDGTRDIGPPGGGKRVLLLRMLDWNTRGEEIIRRLSQEIARMIGKQGKEQEAQTGIVRVATIHDKTGRGASWGFAFVELVTTEVGPWSPYYSCLGLY
jgi:RNA-binding protein 5/10